MTDREKVIKEFELFIKEFHPACTSEGVELDMLREVLALLKDHEDLGAELTNAVELIRKKNKRIEELLKEQEAVEPKKCWFLNNMNIPEEHWFCGKCNKELVGNGKYCANCGQAVKWNE